MTLTQFATDAKKIAFENELPVDAVSVFAFIEKSKPMYVCQIELNEQILRAPVMLSVENALKAFESMIADEKDNMGKNNDIGL